jgi:hypothetical protein
VGTHDIKRTIHPLEGEASVMPLTFPSHGYAGKVVDTANITSCVLVARVESTEDKTSDRRNNL